MSRAEAPPGGAWTGAAQGGVKAPEPILLPDPDRRFAATAQRLGRLAAGHPMQDWLRFLSQLSAAQQAVASTLAPGARPDRAAVRQASAAGLPPLAVDGHRRAAAWRDGLARLLEAMHDEALPPAAREVIAQLQRSDAESLEDLAERLLRGSLPATQAGAAVYIAAALQVYFTVSASRLAPEDLRLLEERSLCPCCGSPPVAGLITASGRAPGTRYLYCSLCSSAWNHVRAVCITCGGTRRLCLQGIDGDPGLIRAETCDDCHTYSKVLYQLKDMQVDPYADDLASLGLDLLLGEAGFARHAANPLLLMGGAGA